jgi:hypothetical protein
MSLKPLKKGTPTLASETQAPARLTSVPEFFFSNVLAAHA